jgi:hypothetical protein
MFAYGENGPLLSISYDDNFVSVRKRDYDSLAYPYQASNERARYCTSELGAQSHQSDSATSQITRGIHTDCLINYETVKYFNGEEHEGARYSDAIREYQSLEYKVISKCLCLE